MGSECPWSNWCPLSAALTLVPAVAMWPPCSAVNRNEGQGMTTLSEAPDTKGIPSTSALGATWCTSPGLQPAAA